MSPPMPRKGGVKGGHSLSVETTRLPENQLQRSSAYPTPLLRSPNSQHHNNATQRQHQYRHPLDPEVSPKGLVNVGNTCYANAALQCLLSTALANALLDPKVVPLFRRYSSNPNLLAQGSGSVDDEEENEKNGDNGSGQKKGTNEQAKLKKKAAEEARRQRQEKEAEAMLDNCRWLTRELTTITQQYTARPTRAPSSQASYSSWFSTPTPAREADAVDPGSITRRPDRLSKCLQPYQQEDAHEFMRALLSTLVMNGRNKQLSSLFDGLLESAVTCQSCGRASLTRDRYMDLSLDINDPEIKTVDDALFEYTKSELLQDDNAVFCPKCDQKQTVTKGLRLATAPSILVCHLKRFAFDKFGRLIRLHKRVKFEETLEIGEYMSKLNKARPPPYDLVGVLVHQGRTCASGHYISFVKKNDEWYKCNDSIVTKVDQETVMEQQAYILMYEVAKMRERTGCTPKSKVGKSLSTHFGDDCDDAEMSTDGTSTHCSSSWKSFDRSTDSAPLEGSSRFSRFLHDSGGIARFLTEMCCDSSGLREPQTHELKKKNRRRTRARSPDFTADSKRIQKTYSNNRLNAMDSHSKSNIRSQTAPRQRPVESSHEFYSVSAVWGSPRASRTSLSEGKASQRQRIPKWQSSRGLVKDRRQLTARSTHNLAVSGDLPPRPKPKRATSTTSRRKSGGVV